MLPWWYVHTTHTHLAAICWTADPLSVHSSVLLSFGRSPLSLEEIKALHLMPTNTHTHTHTAVQQTLVNYFFLPCESLIAHINPAVRDKYSSIINQSSRQVLRLSFSCSAHIHPRLVANYTPLNRSLLVRPAAQSSIVQALRLTYSANRGKPKEHHKSLALCYWPTGVCIHPFTFILCALSCSLEEPGSNGGSPPPEPHLPRAHRSCLNNFTRTLSQNMQS